MNRKKIEWFDYEISPTWNVRSITRKVIQNLRWYNQKITYYWKELKPVLRSNWYLHVCLSKWKIRKQQSIHKLVATYFIKNPRKLPQVNHKDWNKLNNNMYNLEWTNASWNAIHAHKTWLSHWRRWNKNILSKKVYQFTKYWKFIKKRWSTMDIERELWLLNSWISACCLWKLKTSWWYVWRYER